MFGRLVSFIILLPLAIVLIALAVANRDSVMFTIDPFNPGNPLLSWKAPLFALLFFMLIIGLVLGSVATWFAQGKYRRSARDAKAEAAKLMSGAQRRDIAQKATQNMLSAS
jgi:uncharacterized integral membrane protein